MTALAGCGSGAGDAIDCGAPLPWVSVEGQVVSVSDVETGSDGDHHADVVVRDGSGVDHDITVWGRPDLLVEGATYHVEVTSEGEAFVDFNRELECLDGAPRQTTPIDGSAGSATTDDDCTRDAAPGDRIPPIEAAFGDELSLTWAVVESMSEVEGDDVGDGNLRLYRTATGQLLRLTASDAARAAGQRAIVGFRQDPEGVVGLGLIVVGEGLVEQLNSCHDDSARLAEFFNDAEGDGAAELAVRSLVDRDPQAMSRIHELRAVRDE
jgi:hypothetical protein